MRRLLFIFVLLCPAAFGQGYSLQNFARGTNGNAPTASDVLNSWQGTIGPGVTTSVTNTAGALLYDNNPCPGDPGGLPPGHTGLALAYSTTTGSGHNNQFIQMFWPTSGASTVTQISFWFCTDYPDNGLAFNNSNDAFQVISGASNLSNQFCTGSGCGWAIEGAGQGFIRQPNSRWSQVVTQFVQGGTCSLPDKSDCVRLELHDRTGALITTCLGSCTPSQSKTAGSGNQIFDITFGNGNAVTMAPGFHMWFADIRVCNQNCSANQFPMLLAPVLPSDGILPTTRAIDWSKSGLPGQAPGTLPSSSWTQCGTTLAAGSYDAASLSATRAACPANTYTKLGPGTFTLTGTGQLKITTSNGGFRGSGSNSTIVTSSVGLAQCGVLNPILCIKSTDGTKLTGSGPATVLSWASGFTKGSTQITMGSAVVGSGTPVVGSLIFLDQCNTNWSGTNCTGGLSASAGAAVDNGQLFVCEDKYNGSDGCGSNGGGSGRPQRGQLEVHVVTAVAGNVLTIDPPLIMPNWNSRGNPCTASVGECPQIWFAIPVTNAGFEDMAIVSTGGGICSDTQNAYRVWFSGIACRQSTFAGMSTFQSLYVLMTSGYVFTVTATPPAGYGIRPYAVTGLRVENMIIHEVYSPLLEDGLTIGNVYAYNFINNADNITNNFMNQAMTGHATNFFNLYEGNVSNQISACDDVHGSGGLNVLYRNASWGWENTNPSVPKGTNTNAVANWPFCRYISQIANVNGTPGYHTTYKATTSSGSLNQTVNYEGVGNAAASPPTPNDALVNSTALYWAEYNTVTNAVRFCGNALDTGFSTTCGSASEAPANVPAYPAQVPVVGDTAIGQASLPASFIYTTRPAWWSSTIPFPAIGPDVTGGDVGQCQPFSNNVVNAGLPTPSTAKCVTGGLGKNTISTAWAGHVNQIPAMAYALGALGMTLAGNGTFLPFDASFYAGGGTAPAVSLTPAPPLTFSPLNVGSTSATQDITVTNTGSATLTIALIAMTGDFTNTTTCGTSLGVGLTCTISVAFFPSTVGTRNGLMTMTDNAPGSPHTFALTGTGTLAPQLKGQSIFSGSGNVK
jgi:hypothetical protein